MAPVYRKWALDNYTIAHRARNKTQIDDVDYINPLNKELDQRRPLWVSPTKLLYVERKPHQELRFTFMTQIASSFNYLNFLLKTTYMPLI